MLNITEWSILACRIDEAEVSDPVLPPGYELSVLASEADGPSSVVPRSPSLRIEVTDPSGRAVHRQSVALLDHAPISLPFPIAVGPDGGFSHSTFTARECRNMGLATAGLSASLLELKHLGCKEVRCHIARGSGSASHRVYLKHGFAVVGRLQAATTPRGRTWIVLGDHPFFRAEPSFRSEDVSIYHEADPSILARSQQLIEVVLPRLRSEGHRVVVFGSGDAATQAVELAPELRGFVDGVVDSDRRRQGQFFEATGHIIGAPEDWSHGGATVLMYSSQPFQDEMRRQHLQFGPSGSLGLRLYPSVELVELP